MSDHLWGHEVRGLGLDDEMEDIELGERVAFDLCMEHFVTAYVPDQRAHVMALLLATRMA